MSNAGKGDSPRPVDKAKYNSNYEHIFGNDKVVKERRLAFIEELKRKKRKLQ